MAENDEQERPGSEIGGGMVLLGIGVLLTLAAMLMLFLAANAQDGMMYYVGLGGFVACVLVAFRIVAKLPVR